MNLFKKVALAGAFGIVSLTSFASGGNVITEYTGGVSNFVKMNVDYPKKAMEDKVEATVWVEFTVTKSGNVVNVKALTSHGHGLEKEVVSAIYKLNGKSGNSVERSTGVSMDEGRYRVPVKFEIR
ncbi:MAG: TonB family protein [Parvicellaceae bacterium]|jgi:TonB family protein